MPTIAENTGLIAKKSKKQTAIPLQPLTKVTAIQGKNIITIAEHIAQIILFFIAVLLLQKLFFYDYKAKVKKYQ